MAEKKLHDTQSERPRVSSDRSTAQWNAPRLRKQAVSTATEKLVGIEGAGTTAS